MATSSLFTVIISLLVVVTSSTPITSSALGNCVTASCVRVADLILQQVNMSADPCEDFYEFACGTFMFNSDPDGTAFQLGDGEFQTIIKKTTKQALTNPDETYPAEGKAAKFYDVCRFSSLDFSSDDASTSFIRQYLDKELHGFSFTKADEKKDERWVIEAALAGNLLQNGTELFQLNVAPDSRNWTRLSLTLFPEPTPIFQHQKRVEALGEDLSYLNEVKQNYVSYLKNLSRQLLPAEVQDDIRETYLIDLVEFELDLARIVPDPEAENPTAGTELDVIVQDYNETEENKFDVNVADMQRISPALNWTFFFRELGKFYKVNVLKNIETFVFSYRQGSYFHKLSHVLANTSNKLGPKGYKRVVHNYFALKAIMNYLSDLSCGYSVPVQNLRNKASGLNADATLESCWASVSTNLQLEDICYLKTMKIFKDILARRFLRAYFPEENVAVLKNVTELVRAEFTSELKRLEWMDEQTRSNAVKKVNNMLFTIGHPDNIYNASYDSKFDLLNVDSNHYSNIENYNHFDRAAALQALDAPLNRIDALWSIDEVDTMQQNAMYVAILNSFVFLAGMGVAPFFGADYPPAYYWGRLATTIGHEIVHGFDSKGKNFDEVGMFRNWWTDSSASEFENRTACLVKQFNDFAPFNDGYGTQVLGESIADNGGFKVAYQAWKKLYGNDYLKRIEIPGLPFTNEQIFFLTVGQNFCYAYDWLAKMLLMTKNHAFPPLRINGAIQNSEPWLKAFNCPVGSPMNPEGRVKCDVW